MTSLSAQAQDIFAPQVAPPAGALPESGANAPPPEAPAPPPPPPEVVKVSENRFTIGKVEIDTQSREVRFPAKVNMREGLIEFPVVHTNGRTHEAIFATDIFPLHLETALRLIRFRPSAEVFPTYPGVDPNNPPESDQWPDPVFSAVQPESHVQVFFSLPESAQSGNAAPEVRDIRTLIHRLEMPKEASAEPLRVAFEALCKHWVFTSSTENLNEPIRPLGGSIVGIRTEKECTFNADQNQELQAYEWFADPKHIPEVGTSVMIHIRPVQTPKPDSSKASESP